MSESLDQNGPAEMSRFRVVIVAALRAKQLLRGSKPRIEPDPGKHKNTSIALEEVRRGLVTLTPFAAPLAYDPAVETNGGSIAAAELKSDTFRSFKTNEGQ